MGGKLGDLEAPKIRLVDLHIFRCVVKEGGVVRAAESLGRVPSSVTTRIKQLEARLDVKLFRPQGRGMSLTDAGNVLLVHAERLLQLAVAAEQDVCSGIVRGVLRIGASESVLAAGLAHFLSRFHEQSPQVAIELRTGTEVELLHMLSRFELDAALLSDPIHQVNMSSFPVFDNTLSLIFPKSMGQVRPNAVSSWVTLAPGCSLRRRLTEWLSAVDSWSGSFVEAGSFESMVALVAAGRGGALIPTRAIPVGNASNAIARASPPSRLHLSRTHLVWIDEATPPLRSLIAMLRRKKLQLAKAP
jgi:DNA-binding transcriptional LysR family regulator